MGNSLCEELAEVRLAWRHLLKAIDDELCLSWMLIMWDNWLRGHWR